ncbi:MAG: serine/threonine-protein kinase, partial [Myxococcota bacterium]
MTTGPTEEVLSARPGRMVVRVSRSGMHPVVVRRVDAASDGASDLSDRLAVLRLLEGRRIPSVASIQRVRLIGSTLDITEAWIDGFSLSLPQAQAHVTVNVALAMIRDVALGLAELHRTPEIDGRPGHLVHGRVTLDRILVDSQGQVWLVGVEGFRGAPSVDASALMDALRRLLERRTNSAEGRQLLERLRGLSFASTEAVGTAIETYLSRLDPQRLLVRRQEFNEEVRRSSGMPLVPRFPVRLASRSSDRSASRAALPAEPVVTPQTPIDLPDDTDAYVGDTYTGLEEQIYSATSALDSGVADERETLMDPFAVDDVTVAGGADLSDILAGVLTSTADTPEPPTTELDYPDQNDYPDQTVSGDIVGPPIPGRNESNSASRETAPVSQTPRMPSKTKNVPPPVGARPPVIGDYRVVASIGRGGMGEIYLARKWRDQRPGPLVALKILASAANDIDFQEALAMLMDEAAIMARIDHPHVLKVTDFGEAFDRYFLATEYLEGRPLVRLMVEAYAREGGLDYGVIATVGADAALGLHAAHTASTVDGAPLRVIHRDVSPQNIFVTYEGVTKVIDFGVARASERVSRTEVGLVKGKAAYMSPEQAEGLPLDGRSDVFGLGICLWEMTAGRRLFKRAEEYETLVAVQSAEIPPPTQIRGSPNPVLDRIILAALQRDREQRTPSAQVLASQLIELADHASGPDRRRRVRALLGRLFGDVANKEQTLIQRLESNAASPAEAAELEQLSGVSAQGNLRQLTLVGRPA